MQSDLSQTEPWVLPFACGPHRNSAGNDRSLFDRVRGPRAGVRAELTARGFVFWDKPPLRVLCRILNDAVALLRTSARLEAAVRAAVGEIVLLRAGSAFDITHSEPRWPQTIFVSVPGRPSQVSALRAAENIVHEAMHLQLTTLEQAHPLVADKQAQMASPWRKEPRDLQGVLHGLYVFRCITAFFATPSLSRVLNPEGAAHVERRQAQIAEELSHLDCNQLANGMTPKGRIFLTALAGELSAQPPVARVPRLP